MKSQREDTPRPMAGDAEFSEAEISQGSGGQAMAPMAAGLPQEFLSIAAHELRSPIATLHLFLHTLRSRAARAGYLDRDEIERLTEPAFRQTARLKNLVQNLLDVSRLHTGRMAIDLDREPMDLAALVGDVASAYRDLAQQAGCRIDVIGTGPIVGNWDRVRLEQVLSNLITNASKYAAGSVIRVVVGDLGERVRLVVEDDGPGVPPAEAERVFEPFVRVATRADAHSLGLGLYIVREIVIAHGGTVILDSQPDQGARFIVTLPR